MFYPMEEQSSHITKLVEENRRYFKENSHMKGRSCASNVVSNENYNMYNNQVYCNGDVNADLEDKILALELKNNQLNLCLEREKRKRREAEARVERDEGYIRRLEDSVQTLRGTRVVMDPSTYRQVAEAYIAAKRTPARRPHTHSGLPGSDLVCDSARDPVMDHQRMSHPVVQQSISCPSSPNSCSSSTTSRHLYSTLDSQDSQMYSGEISLGRSNGKNKNNRSHTSQDLGRGLGTGSNTMNPWDYQQLLQSLEDLDGASRGALS